jgi:hypothetical protein
LPIASGVERLKMIGPRPSSSRWTSDGLSSILPFATALIVNEDDHDWYVVEESYDEERIARLSSGTPTQYGWETSYGGTRSSG